MWRDSKGNPATPAFGFVAPPRAQWSPLIAPPGMRLMVAWSDGIAFERIRGLHYDAVIVDDPLMSTVEYIGPGVDRNE